MLLRGRGPVDTDAAEGGSSGQNSHTYSTVKWREGREKGGRERRCFVPAFQAETLGLKMVFSRADRTGELSVHTSLSVCLTEQTNVFNMELYTSNHRDTCS